MAKVRKIGLDEFRDIYQNYIVHDFPPEELKPFWVIKKSYRNNRYSAYIYEESEQLQGYASFSWQNEDVLLLDYFAVLETQRSHGIGSAFLKKLAAALSSLPVRAILFECETPSDAKNEQDRLTRERRIRFYERNGVVLTDTVVRVFGVNYSMMYLPVNANAGSINVGEEILNIYHNQTPKLLFKQAVKIVH